MTDSSPLPSSSPLSSSPAVASPTPPPSTQPRGVGSTPTPAGNRTSRAARPVPEKKALTFDLSSTAVVSGLPSQQKAKVLLSYFHKYLERGHPDSPLKPEDDGEKRARLAAAYEIAAQYFRTEYEEAQDKAEARDRTDDGPYTDSSDEDDGFVPPLPIFWFGGHPYRPEQNELGVADSALAAVGLIERTAADVRARAHEGVRGAWTGAGLPPIFSFAPVSGATTSPMQPMDAADTVNPLSAGMSISGATTVVSGESMERAWAESAPPVSPTQSMDAADTVNTVNRPSAGVSTKTASGAPAPAPASSGSRTSNGDRHPLRLLSIFGWRDVECRCVDGKHHEFERHEVCAFNAHDGTLVVRTMSTEVIPLN
ncbi:hypothetical protein R3P38DRAFT_3187752 [Favolaschia claudopus]|uniref:J domain-containing protein n=1 Tax=Favolaschia claudopus TaxID=2862362 RepID=A0AAW0BY53_9AGAR